LDLAATAALAFEDPSPAASTPAASMDDDDPFFTSVGEPPAFDAGPSPPFPLHDEPPPFPMPGDAEPIGVAAEPESPEPAGFVMTEPGEDDPHTLPRASAFVPPIPGEDPEPGLAAGPNESAGFVGGAELETTALPVMEPPPSFSAERIAAEVPEVGHDPVPPSRPSREDLAALDALLNPATTPRPLEPAKAPNKSGRWEPQFQSMARPRRPPSSQASPVLLISLAAGAIALVAAGSWYYLRQVQGTPIAQAPVSPPSPSPLAPTPLPPPTPAVDPLAATPMPVDAPVALPTAEATPLPVAAPVSPLDNGPVTDARSLMRHGSFGPAAKGFAANVKSATGSPFTIQLLVACSSDTVQKALDQVASDDLYILPVSYQGRSCNRICWGLYPDEAGAEQAVATLPDYFRQNGALPKVVKTTTLLR
jgi:septal ring-binding cell division protein DamX